MNDFVNSLKSAALSVGEMLTPVLKESKFKETGVLTPDEFVAAGDHLVYTCQTWSWSSASDPSRVRDYLPSNKQFLITRRVPCHQRCTQMAYDSNLEMIINEQTDDGEINEWVDTHHFEKTLPPEVAMTFSDIPKDVSIPLSTMRVDDTADSDEDDPNAGASVDMDAFIKSGALEDEDPNRYIEKRTVKNELEPSQDSQVEQTRTYDLHITYDKYYQVPRFWIIGYDEQGKMLSVDQMKQDFSQDHADKTITLESHPHVGNLSFATIHPCRHASVMKQLIEMFAENGRDLSVLEYLFVFLKFVQAVIPTVEYDYTRSIQF